MERELIPICSPLNWKQRGKKCCFKKIQKNSLNESKLTESSVLEFKHINF